MMIDLIPIPMGTRYWRVAVPLGRKAAQGDPPTCPAAAACGSPPSASISISGGWNMPEPIHTRPKRSYAELHHEA